MIKETQAISQLKIALKAALLKIEKMLETREAYYDSRSEKWLESDKADEYLEDTENLQSFFDSLTEVNEVSDELFEQ